MAYTDLRKYKYFLDDNEISFDYYNLLKPYSITSAEYKEHDEKFWSELYNDLREFNIIFIQFYSPLQIDEGTENYYNVKFFLTNHKTYSFVIDIIQLVKYMSESNLKSSLIFNFEIQPYFDERYNNEKDNENKRSPEPQESQQDKKTKKTKNKDYPTISSDDALAIKLSELKAESKKLFAKARDIDFTKAYPHKAKITASYEEYTLKFDRHGENLEVIHDITPDKGQDTPLRDLLRAGLQPALRDTSTFKYGDNINKNVSSLQKIRDRKKELETIIKNTQTQLQDVNKNLDEVTRINEFAKQVTQATQTTETDKKGGN